VLLKATPEAQLKEEAMRELYAGIDLHSTNSVVVVTNGEGREVYRERLPNVLEVIVGALSPWRERMVGVVVESTYNWYWLVDGLMAEGYRVHLANTAAIAQYAGLKYSDDSSDARWLAHLLSLGILPEGHIYPKETRAVRDLLRKRSHLVRQRTANILSFKNLVARSAGRSLSAALVKRMTDDQAGDLFAEEETTLAATSTLAVVRCLEEQIHIIERAVMARMRDKLTGLCTVSGIGKVLALTIALETGDMGRFRTVGDYVSYSRCVRSERISNGKRKGKGNTRNGNRYLAWAFVEAANFAIRYDDTIKRYYQRKQAKTKRVVALKAVAHKLARACYYIQRDGVPFDVVRAFT